MRSSGWRPGSGCSRATTSCCSSSRCSSPRSRSPEWRRLLMRRRMLAAVAVAAALVAPARGLGDRQRRDARRPRRGAARRRSPLCGAGRGGPRRPRRGGRQHPRAAVRARSPSSASPAPSARCGRRPGARRGAGADRADARALGLALVVAATLAGLSYVRPHHLFFLVLAPVWLIGRLDRAALRPWAAPAFAAALVLLLPGGGGRLPIETRRDAADCDACEEFQPVETYARVLRAAGFDRGTILALSRRQDFPTAALAMHFPDARLVAADYTVYAPPPGAVPGDCLIVWSGAADWPEGWGPARRCPGSGCRCRRGGDRAGDRAAAPLRAADAGDALRAGEGRARRLPLRTRGGRIVLWSGMDDLSLRQFVDMDRSRHVAGYVAALEAFDGIPGLQELKTLGRERGGVAPGRSLLDVGCGFGLETLRLAAAAGPGATVAGIDKSADFIADAAARATAAGLARRLPGRRRDRPALGRRELRRRARRAAADLPRRLAGGGARDAAGGEARGRARLHRARLLDDDGQPARPVGGAPRARPRGRHRGGRELAAGSAPRLPCRTSGSAGSRWRPGWRSSRRTSARPTSRRSGGTPPRPGRSPRPSSTPGSRGSPTCHARGRLFGTVGYFLFTARTGRWARCRCRSRPRDGSAGCGAAPASRP